MRDCEAEEKARLLVGRNSSVDDGTDSEARADVGTRGTVGEGETEEGNSGGVVGTGGDGTTGVFNTGGEVFVTGGGGGGIDTEEVFDT